MDKAFRAATGRWNSNDTSGGQWLTIQKDAALYGRNSGSLSRTPAACGKYNEGKNAQSKSAGAKR
jgi:hypothetical protein